MRLPTIDGGLTLLVGLDDAPPSPIQIGRPEDGNFAGYEVDLLLEVQHRLDIALRYRREAWSVIVNELSSGKLDVVCSAATITEARKRQVDFCRPHLAIALAIVRHASDPAGISLQAARVGVRRGTTAEQRVRIDGTASVVRLSESNDEIYASLSRREIDLVVDDSPIAAYFARLVPGLRVAGALPESEAAYACMVKKGNSALKHAINATLIEMEAEGLQRSIRERWLGESYGG